jgi:hypothetical protein
MDELEEPIVNDLLIVNERINDDYIVRETFETRIIKMKSK